MDKNKIKLLVDIAMAIAFLLVGLTGILKMPQFFGFFSGILSYINFGLMSKIHDWSGVVLVLLILMHLCLNWNWIRSMILCTFRKQKKCEIKKW